jgi:catechol 2,3-dioxygenase-like lactoylglutathione lyase family enzyme
MLGQYDLMPTLATADLAAARGFYEGTLGFPAGEVLADGAVLYRTRNSRFLVYRSAYAGTNKATAMAFDVPAESYDAEVAALRAAGIAFDTFDLEGIVWEDGVATMEGERSAWFADPDGNILAVTCQL